MKKKKKLSSSATKRTGGKSGSKKTSRKTGSSVSSARKKASGKSVKKALQKKVSSRARKSDSAATVHKKPAKKGKPVQKKMSAAEKEEYREMLFDMRRRVIEQIDALKKDSLRRDDSVNSEEDGTDAFERQFALTIASSENELLLEIDEALRRLDEGLYGICNTCNERIEKARLIALPFCEMCVRCKAESEKTGNITRFGSTMNHLAGESG